MRNGSVMTKRAKKKPAKPLSPLARDIVASLKEYAAYKRGRKTNTKVYVFQRRA